MLRVIVATVLVLAAVQVAGCTGSLRVGSAISAVTPR